MVKTLLFKFTLILIALFVPDKSQNDTLTVKISPEQEKLERIEVLLKRAKTHVNTQPDSVMYLTEEAISLSQEDDYLPQIAKAKEYVALSHYYSFKYEKAMELAKESYEVWNSLNDNAQKGNLLNLQGMIYWREGQYSDAQSNYRKALNFYTLANDGLGQTKVLNNIGNLMNELRNTSEAIKYFLEAEKICEVHSPKDLPIIYNNLGSAYVGLNKCDSAMFYFDKALFMYNQQNDKAGRAFVLNNMGNVYVKKDEFDKALGLYKKAEIAIREDGRKQLLAKVMYNISMVANVQKDYTLARKKALEAYNLAVSIDFKLVQKNAARLLMGIGEVNQNYEEAFHYSQEYIKTNDSLFVSQKMLELGRMEAGYSFDKEQVVLNEKIKRQDTVKTGLLVVLILSILLVIFLLRIFTLKKSSNKILERKNMDLAIQKARIEYLNKNLESLVNERTIELQSRNLQLERYAFINAHEVRAPLARILGLMHLRELNRAEQEEEDFFVRMQESALELDEVVKNMNVELEESGCV